MYKFFAIVVAETPLRHILFYFAWRLHRVHATFTCHLPHYIRKLLLVLLPLSFVVVVHLQHIMCASIYFCMCVCQPQCTSSLSLPSRGASTNLYICMCACWHEAHLHFLLLPTQPHLTTPPPPSSHRPAQHTPPPSFCIVAFLRRHTNSTRVKHATKLVHHHHHHHRIIVALVYSSLHFILLLLFYFSSTPHELRSHDCHNGLLGCNCPP